MAEIDGWPPERLRALDRAVAEVEGWWEVEVAEGCILLPGATPFMKGYRLGAFILGEKHEVPRYSSGEGLWPIIHRDRITYDWDYADGFTDANPVLIWSAHAWGQHGNSAWSPTIPIAICLALLAKAGKGFE